jgi:pimeloyl-ACP methyl ester carboxylesterase
MILLYNEKMNRLVTEVLEKSLAYGFYGMRVQSTPNPFRPLTPAELACLSTRPEEFYSIPAEPPRLEICHNCLGVGGMRDPFTFPSAFTTHFPENNTVHGLANLRTEGQARGALIIIHGHTMTTLALLEWYARPAISLGMDVYFLALPYHMQRAPHGTWSGQYSLNADIAGSALAFKQGVQDVRSLISWIEAERPAPVMLAGVSLGAYTCCMTAVVDERPKAVISILGGGSLAQILWDGYQVGRSRKQLEEGGVSIEELERYWKLLGPGNWEPKVARERILLLAGKFDPIVTPANVDRLWQAWGRPETHWYPCGHGTIAHYHHPVRQAILGFLASYI